MTSQQIQEGGRRTDAMLKSFFGYISVPCCPINAKFRERKQNHTERVGERGCVTKNSKLRKFKVVCISVVFDFEAFWCADAYFGYVKVKVKLAHLI